jgi:general secretion pathway protein D
MRTKNKTIPAILTLVLLSLWGCATLSQTYKMGTQAAINKDWERAVELFEQAAMEHPKNSYYRLALIRARIQASRIHWVAAQNLAQEGRKDEAIDEYNKALAYDPQNIRIVEDIRRLERGEMVRQKREFVPTKPPVMLKSVDKPIDLKFTEASLQSIFTALGKLAGVNVLFDEQYRDQPYTTDMSGMSFEEALNSLCLAAKCFSRVINPATVIIVPDRPDKRVQYELHMIKTFYLSNINAQDVSTSLATLLRTQFRAPTIFVDKELNAITLRDVPQVVDLAERMLNIWDKAKGEVVIDLEIMEVSRQRLKNLGLDLDAHSVGLGYSGSEPSESGWYSMGGLDFSSLDSFQVTLPTAFLQFLETDADTKTIAQPRLRGVEGQEITYIVGDEVPVPSTTFTPIAAGGYAQQPVVSYDYKTVGIDITMTPTIHLEGDVTLDLQIKIKSLGGSGYADLPIITSREIKNVIRLKNGETNLLAGLLKDEERTTKKGIFGIKNIPLLGGLLSNTDQNIQQTDVIMTITPYIIRAIDLTDEDRKPLWVNLDSQSASEGTGSPMAESPPTPEMLDRRRVEEGPSGPNIVNFSPNNFEVAENREFRMGVNLRSSETLANFSMNVTFNSQILELTGIMEGGIVTQGGRNAPFMKNIDNSSGSCTLGYSSPDVTKGFRGAGRLATLVFKAKAKGETQLAAVTVTANSASGKVVNFTSSPARIRIR